MLLRQFFIRTKMYLNLKEIILKGLKRGNKQTTLTIEQVACYVTVYRDNRQSTCIFFPVTETIKEIKIIKPSVFKLKKKNTTRVGLEAQPISSYLNGWENANPLRHACTQWIT